MVWFAKILVWVGLVFLLIFKPGKWFVTSNRFLEGFWQSVTCGCRKRRRGGRGVEEEVEEEEEEEEVEEEVGGGRKGGNSTTTVTPAPSNLLQLHFKKFRKQQAC